MAEFINGFGTVVANIIAAALLLFMVGATTEFVNNSPPKGSRGEMKVIFVIFLVLALWAVWQLGRNW